MNLPLSCFNYFTGSYSLNYPIHLTAFAKRNFDFAKAVNRETTSTALSIKFKLIYSYGSSLSV